MNVYYTFYTSFNVWQKCTKSRTSMLSTEDRTFMISTKDGTLMLYILKIELWCYYWS